LTQRNDAYVWAHQLVEGILVHAEVGWSVAQAQKARCERQDHTTRVDVLYEEYD
jgi:hypothetical protein